MKKYYDENSDKWYEYDNRGMIILSSNSKNRYSTNSRTTPLHTQPHYTEDDFKHAQTVFGQDVKGLGWDYDDRIREWDYNKANMAWEKAKESGHTMRSANFYEDYLSEYFGKPVDLICIKAGFNVSNGYPYCVFGYKFK